jgi:CRP/FNR family transcriptional regulator
MEVENLEVKHSDVQVRNFFNELNADELQSLSAVMDVSVVKKGQYLYKEGSVPAGLYCLSRGRVKISKRGDEGKEQIINLFKDGSMLGYGALLSGETYGNSAIATEDSEVLYFPKNVFLTVAGNNSELSFRMMKMLSSDVRTAEKYITIIAQKPVRERLAEALLRLRTVYQADQDELTIDMSLTREEIANIVGTATETAIRLLSEFRKDNIIELSGKKIKILNLKKLTDVANANNKIDRSHTFLYS